MLCKESPNKADGQGLQIKVHGRVWRWLTQATAESYGCGGGIRKIRRKKHIRSQSEGFKIPPLSQSESGQLKKLANVRREALPFDRDRW